MTGQQDWPKPCLRCGRRGPHDCDEPLAAANECEVFRLAKDALHACRRADGSGSAVDRQASAAADDDLWEAVDRAVTKEMLA